MRLMKEFELQGHTSVHGIEIDIENKAGSVRSGVDKDGHEWHTDMHFDYGYIVGARGVDKDEVDVYVGPNPESEKVFIVHQNDPVTGVYDEDKVMLGFSSPEEAKIAYLSQYDRPGFFGTMDETDMETFQMAIVDPDKTEKKLGILWNRDMIARLNKGPDMDESKKNESNFMRDFQRGKRFIVIINAGNGRQALWPETKKPELYTEPDAKKIVADNKKGSSYAWHYQPIQKALEYIDRYGSHEAYNAVEDILWALEDVEVIDDSTKKMIPVIEDFQIPETDIVLEKGDQVRIKEERQLQLPLLTIIVHGGRVFGYSKEDVEDLVTLSTEADNVPGWMYRAFLLGVNKKSKLHVEIKNLSTPDVPSGIMNLLKHIALGNPAIINLNSEQNYREANLIWLRPL